MRYYWTVILALSILLACVQQPLQSPEGMLTAINDMPVLVLCGTHQDRGFQHGRLLGRRIIEVFEEFIIMSVCKGSDSVYNNARTFLIKHIDWEQKYRIEAAAMIRGMNYGKASLYCSVLDRTIDSIDILILNTTEELFNVVKSRYGCSSVSSWGTSTIDDPQLKGELVITRHWDYFVVQGLIRNLITMVHIPYESDEQRWVSCAWAGMIGSCSAMNESGVGAFLDYGAFFFEEEQYPHLSTHHPICLSIRNGIEMKDYNGSDGASVDDVVDAVKMYVPFFGSLIHVVSSATSSTPALIIESNNERGLVVRKKGENSGLPGDNLAITNHYRVLYEQQDCRRYRNIIDSLESSEKITIQRSWDLLAGAGATPLCLISLTYVPYHQLLRCSYTKAGTDTIPAYDFPSTTVTLDYLFSLGK